MDMTSPRPALAPKVAIIEGDHPLPATRTACMEDLATTLSGSWSEGDHPDRVTPDPSRSVREKDFQKKEPPPR